MNTVTLSSKGQLVIPKALRDQARLVAGARFAVTYVDGEIHLRLLQDLAPATPLSQVAGCLARPGRKRKSDAEVRATVQARLKARHAP